MPAYRIRSRFTVDDWQMLLPAILSVGLWLYIRGLRKVPR